MSLGFSVEALAPFRGGRAGLRMGLVPISEHAWRQRAFDASARARVFDGSSDAVVTLPSAQGAARETVALLGVEGGLADAARAGWEDLCIVERQDGAHVLIGGAVGFPTDWHLRDKVGLPLTQVHAPIHGYAEKLASGVEHFLTNLQPGQIFGRANWFVVEGDAWRYLPQGSAEDRFAHVTAANAGRTLWVRCERQTFRRLPETGAILFAIGIHLARLDTLSPELVCDLATAVGALPEGEDARRGASCYALAIAAYAAARGRRPNQSVDVVTPS